MGGLESLVSNTGSVDDGLESVEFFSSCESSAESLEDELAVGEVVAAPDPRLIVGLERNELAERILRGYVEVSNDLEGLVLAHKDSSATGVLVLEELQVSGTTFLELFIAPSVEFRAELLHDFFLLLAGDNLHLIEHLDWLEVASTLRLRIVVLVNIHVLFGLIFNVGHLLLLLFLREGGGLFSLSFF